MIRVENGEVEMQGTTQDLMADITIAVTAFKEGVIDGMPEGAATGIRLVLMMEIQEALSGAYSNRADVSAEKVSPDEQLKAAEELNRFFDRLEKDKKGWRKSMNLVMLSGRLVSDPMINANGEHTVARYRLAVERRVRKDAPEGIPTADFISCVVFGKDAEFADKYLRKGMKMIVKGHIQTGKYEKDGQTIYSTDVIVEEQEFAESKRQDAGQGSASPQVAQAPGNTSAPVDDGFMNIPEGAEENLPFV